jgi:hypothetical protein
MFKTGEIIEVPTKIKILKPFALDGEVYYIGKPLNSGSQSIWILASNLGTLNVTEELLEKAYIALDGISEEDLA